MRFFFILIMSLQAFALLAQEDIIDKNASDATQTLQHFFNLFSEDELAFQAAIKYIEYTWRDEYISMLLDAIFLSESRTTINESLRILREQTGKKYYKNIFKWFEWQWNQEQKILPFYGDWLAGLHHNIDPHFDFYFRNRTHQTTIRLDEVKWGGVPQDGIPPLRQPKMLEADDADYLGSKDVIFGIEINGDARAYPKRILAWHEMFVDEIGGELIAGVYCTLCGTVIAYNTKHDGINHKLGTSGFLYRSNKLMYDKATQSLWNTIEGKPVIGPLINQGIELKSHSVVTTSWKEWKAMHPNTKVLSLDTGHTRNYDEGMAYRSYFNSDKLMFNVPKLDNRLKNKQEVLIVRAPGYQDDPLAISAKFLKKNRIYHDKIADTNFVVLTDKSGGNRAYNSLNYKFKQMGANTIEDETGGTWKVTEEKLINADGNELNRLPYHRIFWFAWYNSFYNTRLVK